MTLEQIITFLFLPLFIFSCTKDLNKTINIDGSSTTFLITETISKEFNKKNPDIKINLTNSGTSEGFKKFLNGETELNNASRPINEKEIGTALKNNIKYIELPLALDGIVIVINPKNTWLTEITVEELNKIWAQDSNIFKWSDIRSSWPDHNIRLYGPSSESGTFDYFTYAINQNPRLSRNDYIQVKDSDILATNISGEIDSMGYLSYSYYTRNQDKLKAVAISAKKNPPVLPNTTTIKNGSYTPLTRLLYIYANTDKLKQNKNLRDYMNFFMEVAPGMVGLAGYVQLDDNQYKRNLIILEKYSL